MNIEQFRYSADNLAYLLYNEGEALVIDGGAVDEILSFIDEKKLTLRFAANTHSHPDHTMGTKEIVQRSGAELLDNQTLRSKGNIMLGGETIEILHTPGHTMDSICFLAGNFLVSGDTMFNGTVGNCFSGDLEAFFKSIQKLASLPDDTLIYTGHDYVKSSMAFAKKLEPGNEHIKAFLAKHDPSHVYSTLAEERSINPYLKFNDEKMRQILVKRGLPVETEYERWHSLMQIGD